MARHIRWKFAVVLAVAASSVVVIFGGYVHYLNLEAAGFQRATWRPEPGDTLIICGGGSVPAGVRECFVGCAGGHSARLVIIPAYDPTADDRMRLASVWEPLGVASIEVVAVANRSEADSAAISDVLARATGVWMSGGSQIMLGDLYAGTEVERQLHALLERGGVIGGTSAGAAAMSELMIAGKQEFISEQPGLDLLHGTVVDQHFFHRNRTQRLLEILEKHPNLVGLGVDEHSAVVVQDHGEHWSVIGDSYAMICLPSGAAYPRLEILKAGDSTNITMLREHPDVAAINSPSEIDEMLGPSAN